MEFTPARAGAEPAALVKEHFGAAWGRRDARGRRAFMMGSGLTHPINHHPERYRSALVDATRQSAIYGPMLIRDGHSAPERVAFEL